MGQRLLEKGRIPKRDPDPVLQLIQRAGGNLRILNDAAAPAATFGPGYEPDFSWMYSQAWPTVVIFSASSSGISRPVFSSNA